ncbi:MAG: ACT domain-containing protein, partial [Pseudolysinimonas sp.]
KVADRPGVLAQVATLFSEHGVSVEAVEQSVEAHPAAHGSEGAEATATLVIGTHLATEGALADTVAALDASDAVIEVASVLRVEGTE